MKEEMELVVPTGWADVTLRKWLILQGDLENYKDDEEAQGHLMISRLCDISIDAILRMSKVDYEAIKSKLNGFKNPEELTLQKQVLIGGVEFGLEPNLSQMSYGAYADISQYESVGIDKNWGKIMSILYRPVVRRISDMWEIEPYKAIDREQLWLDVTMDIHFGAMFFFLRTSMDLYNGILKSTMEMALPPNIKLILAKSGKHIQQSMTSPKDEFKILIK